MECSEAQRCTRMRTGAVVQWGVPTTCSVNWLRHRCGNLVWNAAWSRVRVAAAGREGASDQQATNLAASDHYQRLGDRVDAAAAPLREPRARVGDALSPAVADHGDRCQHQRRVERRPHCRRQRHGGPDARRVPRGRDSRQGSVAKSLRADCACIVDIGQYS